MDDKGFAFEQRKPQNKSNNTNNNFNEVEYSKGGGDDNDKFSRTGYVKSQVFSRQCHSDPQNPGKIICKESTGRAGYNPFDPNDQNNKYNKYSENVYTRDVNNGFSSFNNTGFNNSNHLSIQQNQEPNLWKNLSTKVKSIFSKGDNEGNNPQSNQNPNKNWNQSYNYNNNNNYHQNESFEKIKEQMNHVINDLDRAFSSDFFGPSIITNLFSDPFLNNNQGYHGTNYRNNNYDNYNNNPFYNNNYNNNWNRDNNINEAMGIPGVFSLSFGYNPSFDEFLDDVNNNFNSRFDENFQQGNIPTSENNNHYRNFQQQNPKKNIKYRDTKIYDV